MWLKITIESSQKIKGKEWQLKIKIHSFPSCPHTCKKDNHEILSATVSDALSAGYEKLQSSCLVFIQSPNKKVKALYVSKYADNFKLELHTKDNSKRRLSYTLSSNIENGFSMKHIHAETFDADSILLLTIPSFSLFITSGLSFHADVLAMPSSSIYWCPWCLLT